MVLYVVREHSRSYKDDVANFSSCVEVYSSN
ncbi:MAG: palindromic element RPE5 domain-containing protein [Rickettsia endosymbiont of Pentastiridius leporinus]